MKEGHPDPTRRFTDRVEHYVRYRPTYPDGVIAVLRDAIGLDPRHVIADIGSGTGISAELFLRHGHTVVGVEPNDAMRAASERHLAAYERFRAVAGTAEDTTLDAASVDHVVAAQAFHWFDACRAQVEFARIRRAGGRVVLIWNTRRTGPEAFLRDYEALLQEHGTDYRDVQHTRLDGARLAAFLGDGYERRVLDYAQMLDLEGVKGRLISSSYTPPPGDPRHEPMMRDAERLFSRHQAGGLVQVAYDTEILIGDRA
ncbi:MAG: class I SAM-dependent methyltransferase [Acidobacteria bacterium]|nr:class I SAM-dependent methyltransferase [Acidobacteriota bacterium]